jgi:hypothetical protein
MSRYFPQAAYAEDQPLAHTILTAHVLTRGAQVGAGVGLGIAGIRAAVASRSSSEAATATTVVLTRPSLTGRMLRGAGVGTLSAMALMSLALAGRMRGRDEIEWKDRAWRLLANQGQLECDDWTYGGAAAGLAAVALRPSLRSLGWRAVVGGAGAGSVVGLIGYMGWRYGVQGGKWPKDTNEAAVV